MKKICIPLTIAALAFANAQQKFEEVTPTSFKDFYYGKASIGDVNNDGFKDVFFTGTVDEDGDNYPDVTKNELYKNDNGTFVPLQLFPENAVHFSDNKFIDFDNDGLLDLVTTGLSYNDVVNYRTYRWKNTGTKFELQDNLDGRTFGNIEVFDLNHDGLLDYAVNGLRFIENVGFEYKTDVYLNSKTGFLDKRKDIIPEGRQYGKLRVFDIDNDGYLDAVLFGLNENTEEKFTIYKNNKGTFEISQELDGFQNGDLNYADFDSDGDLDFVISSLDKEGKYHLIYFKNNGGIFTPHQEINSDHLNDSSIDIGDINGDGYYDFIAIGSGKNSANNVTSVFIYNPTTDNFEEQYFDIDPVGGNGGINLFDFNNDNNLDVLLYGFDWKISGYPYVTKLFKNVQSITNKAPEPPTYLSATVSADKVTFEWSSGNDDKTPSKALQYEFIVGSAPGKSDIAKYTVTTPHWFLQKENLPNTIYWRVKSIDASKVLSNDSEEQVVSNLSVNNITKESGAVLYPNPVKDVLNIRTEAKVKSYRITNTSGQVVLSKTTDEKSINLSGLSKGLYIVDITFENAKPLSAKIIVN